MSAIGHSVFVSEYSAPDDFECVWEKKVKSSLSANGVCGGNKGSVERLFKPRPSKGEDRGEKGPGTILQTKPTRTVSIPECAPLAV
ncbi:hypothetical protein CO024_00620, partial [Candidatus Gracilibacteria bacterium CG_4_9_14_0_2_um_filter_38_7]